MRLLNYIALSLFALVGLYLLRDEGRNKEWQRGCGYGTFEVECTS